MTRTIVIRKIKVSGLNGWGIRSTDGTSVADRLNTADPLKARAHVQALLNKGYQFKPYAARRWKLIQEFAEDWATYDQAERDSFFAGHSS